MHALSVLLVLYFAASAFGAMAHVRLQATDEIHVPVSTNAKARDKAQKTVEHSAKARLGRVVIDLEAYNPFCPTCVPPPVADHTKGAAVGQVGSSQRPMWITWSDGTILGQRVEPGEPETTLPLSLLATMQAESRKSSMATIAHGDEGHAGLFGVGDEVLPGVQVFQVGSGVVHLQHEGKVEYLALEERHVQPAGPAAKKSKKKKKPKKPKKGKHEIPGARDAVQCDGKTHCTIDRAFVNKLIAKPAQLTKQARLRPLRKDDETKGFKVYGVRKGSLPQLLQLRNGDLLTGINGQPLDSMDAAMKLYHQLRNASHLQITIERRGKPLEMNYDIR